VARTSEDANRFFAGPCAFLVAASQPEHFDALEGDRPEVAFWGRSNVGKSSLINAVTGRKGLARSSRTPGRTQQIVFFDIAGALILSDLPGYGHAKAPDVEIRKWSGLIRRYMRTRPRLRCVLLLIDARRGVMEIDHGAMAFLDEAAVGYQVILTKADHMATDALDALVIRTEQALKKHPAARPSVIVTSAEKGHGIDACRAFLRDFA